MCKKLRYVRILKWFFRLRFKERTIKSFNKINKVIFLTVSRCTLARLSAQVLMRKQFSGRTQFKLEGIGKLIFLIGWKICVLVGEKRRVDWESWSEKGKLNFLVLWESERKVVVERVVNNDPDKPEKRLKQGRLVVTSGSSWRQSTISSMLQSELLKF